MTFLCDKLFTTTVACVYALFCGYHERLKVYFWSRPRQSACVCYALIKNISKALESIYSRSLNYKRKLSVNSSVVEYFKFQQEIVPGKTSCHI